MNDYKYYPDDKVEKDWIIYHQVISWKWKCPLCGYENTPKDPPTIREIATCLKCGRHFENMRQGL